MHLSKLIKLVYIKLQLQVAVPVFQSLSFVSFEQDKQFESRSNVGGDFLLLHLSQFEAHSKN